MHRLKLQSEVLLKFVIDIKNAAITLINDGRNVMIIFFMKFSPNIFINVRNYSIKNQGIQLFS